MNSQEAVIVSLYPAPLKVKRINFSGSPFNMARCKDLAKPEILVVKKQAEKVTGLFGQVDFKPWDADAVARDIIQESTSGLVGVNMETGALPAVWVSEGAVMVTTDNEHKLGPGITVESFYRFDGERVEGKWHIPQAEIDANRAGQDGLLQNLLAEARKLNDSKESIDKKFLENMRPMLDIIAVWYNIQNEGWQQKLDAMKTTKCPYCETVVSATAAICLQCGKVINKDRAAYLDAQFAKMEAPAALFPKKGSTQSVGI